MNNPAAFLSMIAVHTLFSGRKGMPHPRSINDPQALHTAVMRLFGKLDPLKARADGQVLFRAEPAAPQRPAALLIRSSIAPESVLEGLVVRPAPAAPATDSPVAFRLAVNAVRRPPGGGINPVPRDDDPQQELTSMSDWVAAKLAGAVTGVELLNHDRNVLGRKPGRVVQTDLVDGFGVVEDMERLTVLLASGIGRAKNYGCGLLTVKTIR